MTQTVEQVVGQRIRERRERLGLTQEELGERIGKYLDRPWTRQAVSVAEKGGRDFRAVELVALAESLYVSVGMLTLPTGPLTLPSGETLEHGWVAAIEDSIRDNIANVLQTTETLREALDVTTSAVDRAREGLEVAERAVESLEIFARLAGKWRKGVGE